MITAIQPYMDFSIIIASNRKKMLDACLKSVYGIDYALDRFEVIVIVDNNTKVQERKNLKLICSDSKNPAYKRNLGIKTAQGKVIAFIDDDVTVTKDWLKKASEFFKTNKEFDVVGGPDLIPPGSGYWEKVSDVLLKNKYLGSGLLAHTNYHKRKEVKHGSDIALCNLFIKKEMLDNIGGFNEAIGYGCEDTEILYLLSKKFKARMMYEPSIRVFHKKRKFPLAYLKQRFKFRSTNGKMLYVYPELYLKSYKLMSFFIAITFFLVLSAVKPLLFPILLIFYFILVILTSLHDILKDWRMLFVLPFAFLLHHMIYYLGILWGILNFMNYPNLRKIRRT